MPSVLIFLFLFKEIITDCFWKCSTCNSFSNTDANHDCILCIPNTYKYGPNNCYFKYEVPRLFLDSDDTFSHCSTNCYECENSDINCLSCNRGYILNREDNTCNACDDNYYTFILDDVEECQGGENGIHICELKKTICTNINNENYECPREYPLLVNNKKECALEIYRDTEHIISNKIIKTQWLNKRIKIGEDHCWYITSEFSSKGDLILETNIYNNNEPHNTRFFYGIKSNGRPLFYDNDNNDNDIFTENKIIEAIATNAKFESQLIKIKLVNNDKDYYLSCSFSDFSIEINDFYNNKIIGINGFSMFGPYYWSTKLFSILALKNEIKTYLFCFIVLHPPRLMLQKFKFYKADLSEENSYEKILSSENNLDCYATQSKIISCIEISTYNVIQCLYINFDKHFVISLFSESSLELIRTIIIDNSPIVGYQDDVDWDYFFQCIYFKNDISILSYVLDPDSDLIYVKIKHLIYKNNNYELEDFFLRNKKIVINTEKKYSFSPSFFFM